jgi:integrase
MALSEDESGIVQLFQRGSLPSALSARIAEIASNIPELADLSHSQVDAIASVVVIDGLKEEMRRALLSARINWKDEVQSFLSDKHSCHTRIAYDYALKRLFSWLDRKHLAPTDLTPRLADDFIRSIRADGKDTDTSRLYIAAASSFYTFLERRFDEIRNPFRGTKARPKATWAMAVIPSREEIALIVETAEPILRAALMIVVETGLRVGGLIGMTIRSDGTLITTTKGAQHIHPEPLSEIVQLAIKTAGLDPRHPFKADLFKMRGETIALDQERFTAIMKTRLSRHVTALMNDGKIKAKYSFHDFRHAYADQNASKGLVWLRDHLGQSSIMTTEKYLRNVLGRDTRSM